MANEPRDTSTPAFFDAHQRETIEAAMARIIPTDDTPGAREANTIAFLDRYLSGIDFVYAKPDGSGFAQLTGKRAAAWQKRIDIVRVEGREPRATDLTVRFGHRPNVASLEGR